MKNGIACLPLPEGPGARFALYYAPEATDPLAAFGDGWLGRDPRLPADEEPRPASGLGSLEHSWRPATEAPRRYGFHATLKAPFQLTDGSSPDELAAALAAFCSARAPFSAPPLAVATLGGFVALIPTEDAPKLDDMAGDIVRQFDRFRAEEPPDKIAERSKGLNERERKYLRRWGYPYVFDRFRFHMTLTGSLADDDREAFMRHLRMRFGPLAQAPLQIGGISLFAQRDRASPFSLCRFMPFGKA